MKKLGWSERLGQDAQSYPTGEHNAEIQAQDWLTPEAKLPKASPSIPNSQWVSTEVSVKQGVEAFPSHPFGQSPFLSDADRQRMPVALRGAVLETEPVPH